MSKDEILSQLSIIIQDTFGRPDIEITAETSAATVEEWDSLSNIRLVVAVEVGFGVRFSTSEIADTNNVGEFVNLIDSRLS